MPTSHAVSLDLVMYAAVILQCLFCHVLAHTITANDVCLHLLVSLLAKWCFFHASCLPNSMYYCINRWRTSKERKAPYATTSFKKGGWAYFQSCMGLFLGDYQNTNSLQHWPQLTTSNILDYIGDFPAYIGKFQAQLIPPIMEML